MSEASRDSEMRGVMNLYPYILFSFPVVSNLLADCPGSQLANLYWQIAKTSDKVASTDISLAQSKDRQCCVALF